MPPFIKEEHNGKETFTGARSAVRRGIGLAAQDLKVVVPQLSPTATDTYSKIIKAIADVSGKKVAIQVMPFARAVYVMETKDADIESALVQNPDPKK